MKYEESRPSGWLGHIVRCFWALEYDRLADPHPELVLPDGCPEIVFNLSDRFMRVHGDREERQPAALFAGQMSRSIKIRPVGKVKLFGVRLQPAGASSLVKFPVGEITDQIIEFADVFGREGRDLVGKLNEALSFSSRIAMIENWITTLAASGHIMDGVAAHAAMVITRTGGSRTITELANSLGTSERILERRFKLSIGMSPKAFSRIIRFQSVVKAVQNSSTAELLNTGLSLGYYDQSHLIRDFREFSGITPLAFFNQTHQISDVFTGAA